MSNYSNEQKELLAFIKKENADFVKECQAENSTPFTLVVEDLDHWASYGVTNIASYERYMAIELYVDLHKEVYNFKPRGTNFDALSLEAIESECDYLVSVLKEQNKTDEEHKQDEKEAIAKVQKESHIPNQPFANLKEIMVA